MGMFDPLTLGIPTLSLKTARKGLVIQGVLLPIPTPNPDTGVVDLLAFREDQDRDDQGRPKTYPRTGNPIMVGQFCIQTTQPKLSDWDYTSVEFQSRTEQFPDETDQGIRRWFLGSKYASDAVRAAYRTLRVPPEVGSPFRIEVLAMKQATAGNGEKYVAPDLAVAWKPADDEGKRIASEYAKTIEMPPPPQRSETFFGNPDGGQREDPWATPSTSQRETDEPPF